MSGLRATVAFAVLLSVLCGQTAAQTDTTHITDALSRKKSLLGNLKTALSTEYTQLQANMTNSTVAASTAISQWFKDKSEWPKGKALDTCGIELPAAYGPACDATLGGNTPACSCNAGRKKVDYVTVKSIHSSKDSNAPRNTANHAAFAAGDSMSKAYKSAASALDYENKWMYFGAVDGSYSIYPGILWPRDKDDTAKCAPLYDPRVRPWYLSAANGPKNIIFMLDVSGSMNNKGRLGLMKKAAMQMIDSLSFADFMGVIEFSSEANTVMDLTFLAPAFAPFRSKMKSAIDWLEAGGSTNYEAALRRAFALADASYDANYDSGCQTAYVFLTDGEQTMGSEQFADIVQVRAAANKARSETFIIIGFGDDMDAAAKEKLQDMACKGKGIFQSVGDAADPTADVSMEKAEYDLIQALSLFSTYFATKNTLEKRDVITYSEIYGMSWDGITGGMEVTTASSAVYDKTDANRWKFLGVVAMDVTVCDIEQKILEKNPTVQDLPVMPEATKFPNCKCASSYIYKEKTYTGGVCIMADWPVAWCMTDGCGVDWGDGRFWADCKPFGARAVLEELLLKSGEECTAKDLDPCELEAIRPAGKKCGLPATCNGAVLAAAEANNYRAGLPGIQADGLDAATVDGYWKQNPISGSSSYDENLWSNIEGNCENNAQCNQPNMKPTCALPSECNAGLKVPTRDSDLAGNVGSVRASFSIQACFLLLLLSLFY